RPGGSMPALQAERQRRDRRGFGAGPAAPACAGAARASPVTAAHLAESKADSPPLRAYPPILWTTLSKSLARSEQTSTKLWFPSHCLKKRQFYRDLFWLIFFCVKRKSTVTS